MPFYKDVFMNEIGEVVWDEKMTKKVEEEMVRSWDSP